MAQTRIQSDHYNRLLIQKVEVWTQDGVQPQVDVALSKGKIEAISPTLDGERWKDCEKLDARGLCLLPAGVDAQVHLRVPGQEQKETATSGLDAAIAGGVGALLTMPNTKPVLDNTHALDIAKELIAPAYQRTGVEVLFSAALTMGQKGHQCVDFEGLRRWGVSAFTDDGVGVADDQVMIDTLRGVAGTGLPLLQHAEVPGHGCVLAEGPVQKRLGIKPYPESSETDMVRRDLELLKKVPDARYHVLHTSASRTIELVEAARRQHLKVSCEVSPHHLYFCSDDVDANNSSFKMNPPLRSATDRRALQSALSQGLCDFMATDHAPHEASMKSSNMKTSAFGTTGLETALRVLLWLWQQGGLSPQRLVEVWSTAPARFLGVSDRFGEVREGFAAHLVLVDPRAPAKTVLSEDFVGLSKNSCFIGSQLPGQVRATILGDRIHHLLHI